MIGLPFNLTRATVCLIIALFLILGLFTHSKTPIFTLSSSQFVPSGYDWSNYTLKYGIAKENMTALPTGDPAHLPPIQHEFFSPPTDEKEREALDEKRDTIKKAFKKTWVAYEKHAWGRDELKPLTLKGEDTVGGWGASIIDSLDTLWLMEMKPEFYRAVNFISSLDWNQTTSDSFDIFQTNVRHLGGLLSAYELSEEPALLSKAIELGDLLYASFDNEEHIPPHTILFQDLKRGNGQPDSKQSSASLGSMSLEFTRLSQLTSNPKYYDVIHRITRAFQRTQMETQIPGIWPLEINALDGFKADGKVFTLGANGDSLYEYLVKEYVLLRGLDSTFRKMYLDAIDVIIERLVFRPMLPKKNDLLMIGQVEVTSDNTTTLQAQLEHTSCFAGGMIALGGKVFKHDEQVVIGDKLARGCAHAYSVFPHGIMPEITKMQACPNRDPCTFRPMAQDNVPAGFMAKDKRYMLRPEAIESIFILYRITGNEEYRELAWKMWTAVSTATTSDEAFASIEDVTVSSKLNQIDTMPTYWMSETLKYFYLIFSDEQVLSLDEWVFNTQGHPLRVSGSS